MLTNDSKVQLSQVYSFSHRWLNRQTQLVALSYSAISSNPKTVSVVSKLQFTYASRSSHNWLSNQPQLVQSSKLVVASLSCPDLGTAQLQLVSMLFHLPYRSKFSLFLPCLYFCSQSYHLVGQLLTQNFKWLLATINTIECRKY